MQQNALQVGLLMSKTLFLYGKNIVTNKGTVSTIATINYILILRMIFQCFLFKELVAIPNGVVGHVPREMANTTTINTESHTSIVQWIVGDRTEISFLLV